MDLKQTERMGEGWIYLAQDRDSWQALVKGKKKRSSLGITRFTARVNFCTGAPIRDETVTRRLQIS